MQYYFPIIRKFLTISIAAKSRHFYIFPRLPYFSIMVHGSAETILNRRIRAYLSRVQRSPRYIPRNSTANQYFRRIQRVSCLYDVSLPTRSLQDVWVCRISVLFNQARGLCPSNARVALRKYRGTNDARPGSPHFTSRNAWFFDDSRWGPPIPSPPRMALRLNKNTKK